MGAFVCVCVYALYVRVCVRVCMPHCSSMCVRPSHLPPHHHTTHQNSKNPPSVNDAAADGTTALHIAAQRGLVNMVCNRVRVRLFVWGGRGRACTCSAHCHLKRLGRYDR